MMVFDWKVYRFGPKDISGDILYRFGPKYIFWESLTAGLAVHETYTKNQFAKNRKGNFEFQDTNEKLSISRI